MKTMPYLLQNSQNSVENIKKKFENSHFDNKEEKDSFKSQRLPSTISRANALHVLKSENVKNCDINKCQFKNDKSIGKLDLNKCDNRAVIRRSPAFRREKSLFKGKSETSVNNVKDSSFVAAVKEHPNNNSEVATSSKTKQDLSHINAKGSSNTTFPKCAESEERNSSNFSKGTYHLNDIKNNLGNSSFLDNKFLVHNTSGDVVCETKLNNRKCELKLTDSIRIALKSPLPKGPPPKKPPRTFIHISRETSFDKTTNNESPIDIIRKGNYILKSEDTITENSSFNDTAVEIIKKGDPTLQSKLEKIEKVVKSLDSKNYVPWQNNRLEQNKCFTGSHTVNQTSAPTSGGSSGQSANGFCLKNFNCISADECETPHEKESQRQSSFFVEHPNFGKDCYKTDRTIHLSGLNSSFDSAAKTFISEPIYDLPCITKKTSFLSFGKVSKEIKKTSKPQEALHYMCTDVVNSLQEELKSPKLVLSSKNDNLCRSFHSYTGTEKHNSVPHRDCTVTKNKKESFNKNCIWENTVSPILENQNAKGNVLHDTIHERLGDENSSMDVDSEYESCSSGMDDNTPSDSAEIGTGENANIPLPCEDRDTIFSSATALRKSYAKKVSSKLLNNSPYTNQLNGDTKMHLFESCILVGLTLGESKTTVPYIKSIFPSHIKPPPLIESLCFPDASSWSHSAHSPQQGEQYYSLVIINENGDRKFGYCRRVLPEGGNFCLPLVYCIISPHRANGFYYKVLQELESRHGSSELPNFINQLYECDFPGPGQSLKFKKILEEVTKISTTKLKECLPSTIVRRPCDVRLEERDLSVLLQHLKVPVLLKVFSSLLHERKVLLLGLSLRNLSSCIEALQSLLTPFSWQYTFIPVLPSNLTEMCDAPTPYVIGLQKSDYTVQLLNNLHFENGIIVDLEESVILKCCGDEGSIIPQSLIKGLKTTLNLALSSSTSSDNDRNVLISESFIRFFVEICGRYSYFMVRQDDGRKNFQKEEFISSAAPILQPFLDWFVETAMFRFFIEERSYHDIDDIFKRRATEDLFSKNCKGVNRKMKSFGDKIKDLTLFSK